MCYTYVGKLRFKIIPFHIGACIHTPGISGKLLMMNRKNFLLHVSRRGVELYTDTFYSRRSLAEHLRDIGLHFTNSSLCCLGDASLKLKGRDGFVYEIEELDVPKPSALHLDGKLFLPIKEYCQLTRQPRGTVASRYKKRLIPGLSVGKPNRIYIYWRDADE